MIIKLHFPPFKKFIYCIDLYKYNIRIMSKREIILETTLNLTAELGLQATSIQLIIKKANIAAGTIYHYFESKEELIDTLYFEIKKEMGRAICEQLDQDINYKDKFILIWKNIFYYYMQNPKKFLFLEDYANTPLIKKEIKEITQRHYQQVIDYFENAIKLGVLRTQPINLMISLVFGNISTLVKMILLEEIKPSEQLIESMIQSSWDSIKIN